MTARRIILALLVVLFACFAMDYARFHIRDRRASKAVSELGGRIGSIGGWPLGKEYVVSFQRPLNMAELNSLAVLNSQVGRNYVGIHFTNPLTPEELSAVQRALPDCSVYASAGK